MSTQSMFMTSSVGALFDQRGLEWEGAVKWQHRIPYNKPGYTRFR
ncbi:hypothetical protein J2W14_003025 [Pseudarthrobacter oxydans]|nr:hypothetical protein [Pseudarthrobacter oxydans]